MRPVVAVKLDLRILKLLAFDEKERREQKGESFTTSRFSYTDHVLAFRFLVGVGWGGGDFLYRLLAIKSMY